MSKAQSNAEEVHREDLAAWGVVAGSGIALSVSSAVMFLFTFGMFIKPIAIDMGWSRQTMSLALGVATTSTALTLPLVGRLVDRVGSRKVALWGVVVFALAFGAISQARSVWQFVALYGLAGIAGALNMSPPYTRAIASRMDRRLGLGLGVALTGIAAGQAAIPQITRLLIDSLGWRLSYITLGAIVLLVAFPAVFLLLHPAGPHTRRAPNGHTAVTLPGLSVREALTETRHFWLIASATFLVASGLVGIIAHLTPLVTDRGLSISFAAALLSVVGISALVGRLIIGYLLDRFPARYVGFVSFALAGLGAVIMCAGAQGYWLFGAVILLGQGLGAEIDMVGYFIRRYLGIRNFGEFNGYILTIFVIGSTVGPIMMALCFDLMKSYNLILLLFGMEFVLASFIILTLGRYNYPSMTNNSYFRK